MKQAATTQFPSPILPNSLTDEEKIEAIEKHFIGIMQVLGLDLNDDSLMLTPHRIAKMYVKEVFSGLNPENFPKMTFIKNHTQSHLVFTEVNFSSFCEHHFVPMQGKAYIAYIPHEKLIGLSKIPRIVKYFASRPQVQERLTTQIADSLATLLETENVAVSLTAQHFCVIARGVENENSHTTTNVLRGAFLSDPQTRREFFEALNRKSI